MTVELEPPLASDGETLAALVDALRSPDDQTRSRAFDLLLQLAASQPAALTAHWSSLATLLDSPNAFHRAIGLRLLAQLAADPRFDDLLPRYLALLDDPKVMVARYLAQSAPGVVALRPDLRETITGRFLQVDATHHAPGRLALIKADILAYLDAVWEASEPGTERGRFLGLARGLLDSDSPSARRAARRFLERRSPTQSQ